MPRISEFFGIVIQMYWNEGNHQLPHFHALYGEDDASVGLDGKILGGKLPARQAKLVEKWAMLHGEELAHNWELARSRQALEPIKPLT